MKQHDKNQQSSIRAVALNILALFLLGIIGLTSNGCKPNPNPPPPEYEPPALNASRFFYSTHNSVRQIDVNGDEFTIAYSASSNDYFGLSYASDDQLLAAGNHNNVWKIDPQYQHYQYNEAVIWSPGNHLSDPSDIEYDENSGLTYICANYGVHKSTGGTFTTMQSVDEVNLPFSLAISKRHLFVAGGNQLSITDLNTGNTALFLNPGIVMAGFMCTDEIGNIYLADPGDNSIKVFSSLLVDQAVIDLENSNTMLGSFNVLTSGSLLDEHPSATNWSIRGPLGIAHKGENLFVTVDAGTNKPGRIVQVHQNTGSQTLLFDDIPGPRDILVAK